jgi:hypothetical protein
MTSHWIAGLIAVAIPFAASTSFLTEPNAMSAATFSTLCLLSLATAAAAFNNWRNGQAMGGARVLHCATTGRPFAPPLNCDAERDRAAGPIAPGETVIPIT